MNPFEPRRAALIFDLDGTILDTLHEIAGSVNELRARYDRPAHSRDVVRNAIGRGAHITLRRTLPEVLDDGVELDDLYEQFLEIYVRRSSEPSVPFPGALRFLGSVAHGHTLAILTNKPLDVTLCVVAANGLDEFFPHVYAPENAGSRKPDPAGLVKLLADLDVTPQDALFLGDTVNDFAAGRDAGVTTVGLRCGYFTGGEPEPDLWVADWDELAALRDAAAS